MNTQEVENNTNAVISYDSDENIAHQSTSPRLEFISDPHNMARTSVCICVATGRTGAPCRNKARVFIGGSGYCGIHAKVAQHKH